MSVPLWASPTISLTSYFTTAALNRSSREPMGPAVKPYGTVVTLTVGE